MVWTVVPVTDAELRLFAEERGGYWNDAVGDEAVIERGNGRVFIGAALSTDRSNVTCEDVNRATSRMGTVPASMVAITIGHGAGSSDLAEEVAKQAIVRWGGFLDRNDPPS